MPVADANLEHPAADLVGAWIAALRPLLNTPSEHEVVHRRPAVVGLLDRLAVEVQRPRAVELMISAMIRSAFSSL